MLPSTLFKDLSDDTRLRCALLIAEEGELCVCELMEALQESQPKISRHLAQLRDHALLADRRQGQWVFYRLHDDLPGWIPALIHETANNNTEYMHEARQRLQLMGQRPQRQDGCC